MDYGKILKKGEQRLVISHGIIGAHIRGAYVCNSWDNMGLNKCEDGQIDGHI